MSEVSIVRNWIEGLRSGNYNQGRSQLRGPANGYCCLGVLCDVINNGVWESNGNNGNYRWGNASCYKILSVHLEAAGIRYLNQDVLVRMNDVKSLTFCEIADALEKNQYDGEALYEAATESPRLILRI